jgi:hypothetical protein
MDRIFLQFCSSSNLLFVGFEERHYVEKMGVHQDATENSVAIGKPRGHQGQQVHYLVWVGANLIGAISGGSSIFSCSPRDEFFGLDTLAKPKKGESSPYLSGIIHNTLFRLEDAPVEASKVLALWRAQAIKDWEVLYGATVYGFETTVLANRAHLGDFKNSRGTLYLADNWVCVGETAGSTKDHVGKGMTGGEHGKPHTRRSVPKKLVYCRWVSGHVAPLVCAYQSSWRGATLEEKALQQRRTQLRRELTLGAKVKLDKLLSSLSL